MGCDSFYCRLDLRNFGRPYRHSSCCFNEPWWDKHNSVKLDYSGNDR